MRELILGLLDVFALGPLLTNGARLRSLENVFFTLGKVFKQLGVEMKVFSDNRLGSVG